MLYDAYLDAPLPDTTATDFESALRYARTLITQPESAKIIVVSDGDETDGAALEYIATLAAEGIKVDTAFFPNENANNEIRIVDVQFPEGSLSVRSEFELLLTLQTNEVLEAGQAHLVRVVPYDNDVAGEEQLVTLSGGSQTVSIPFSFAEPGLHRVSFRISDYENGGDTLTENNLYNAYYYLEVYDDLFILERTAGESAELAAVLEEADYNLTVMTPASQDLPATVDELREYDEVILYNIANADMPVGFDAILNSYVSDYGGSLFTVGGRTTDDSGKTVANAYNRDDLRGTLYQEMLPVEAVDYTPPIAVVFIIDRSGSMMGNKLELAKQGALESLSILSARDWVGVMTLEEEYSEELALTPIPQLADIEEAINSIESGGGTNYTGALIRAGAALSMCSSVQQRHIVILSDAMPSDHLWADAINQTGGYGGAIKSNYENYGITTTIVSVGTGGNSSDMQTAAEVGHGNYYEETDMNRLANLLMEDLQATNVLEYEDSEPFTPRIDDVTTVVQGIVQSQIPQLGGYFGTRLKSGADQPLITPHDGVPVYAQWDYGNGKVGSFMSELSGEWAAAFYQSETGIQLIYNMITALYPDESVKPQNVDLRLERQNYTTEVNIFNVLEGETAEITVTGLESADGSAPVAVEVIQPTAADHFSSASFVIREPGYYSVLVEKKDADGNVIASATQYVSFSYSAEYKYFVDEEASEQFLSDLAAQGGGESIEEAWQAYENLVLRLNRSFDPRILFSILIIVMFLLDVAVRKFKFKWPHEIIRDHRERKKLMQDNKTSLL